MNQFLGRLRRGLTGESGKSLLKLIAFAIVSIFFLGVIYTRIANVDLFADYASFKAEVPDATGLRKDDQVKVAGVGVGRVTGISVERGKAVVSFEVKSDVVLREGTRSGVRWRNILGQKYFYVHPSESGAELESGSTIPIDRAIETADVGEFLNDVGPILTAIDPGQANAIVRAVSEGLQGNEARVSDLLTNAAGLAQEVGALDSEVGRVITNLDTVVGGLADRDAELNQVITNVEGLAGVLADRNNDLLAFVDSFEGFMSELTRLLEENRGDVEATIGNLQVITDTLRQHRGDLDASLGAFPSGLSSLHQVTRVGQWFNFNAYILCVANQRTCVDQEALNTVLGGSGGESPLGPIGSLPPLLALPLGGLAP